MVKIRRHLDEYPPIAAPYFAIKGGLKKFRDKVVYPIVRQRLYDNFNPYTYNSDLGGGLFERVPDAIIKNERNIVPDSEFDTIYYGNEEHNPKTFPYRSRDDIWATYLQIPKEKRHKNLYRYVPVEESPYKPTKGDSNTTYYRVNPDSLDNLDLEEVEGDNKSPYEMYKWKVQPTKDRNFPIDEYNDLKLGENKIVYGNPYFGTYTIGRGVDPYMGEYRSYYDLWDINPYYGDKVYDPEVIKTNIFNKNTYSYNPNSSVNPIEQIINRMYFYTDVKNALLKSMIPKEDISFGIGKPIEFYDRFYLNDFYGVNPKDTAPKKGDYYGGYIPEVIINGNRKHKSLGGHISKLKCGGRVSHVKY